MSQINFIGKQDVLASLPPRQAESHKGSYGSVVAVAGSLSYRGAAALCTEGALRMGAGLVYLASVDPVLQMVLTRTPEVCCLPCRTTRQGGIDPANAATLHDHFERKNAVLLVGPGLGDSAPKILRALFRDPGPWRAAVLDADALTALAADPRMELPQGTVLTPHPGEAARLLGRDVTAADVQANRPGAVQALAQRYRCVAVLKGNNTLIAGPGGAMWRNPTGNPGLARGGSGDVLAGMIAALLAQGLRPIEAACCAVWLHGAAADLTAKRLGQMTMLPQDIFPDLGRLLAAEGR